MAKKQKSKVEVAPEVKATNEMQEVIIEKPVVKAKDEPKKPKWEVKDRVYYLKSKRKPLSYSIRASNIYYFDEELGYERELKNTTNQRTCFVDEMQGDQVLEHIIFRSGTLYVPKNKVVLQKLLSLYHPQRNNLFYEFKPQAIAINEIDNIELELEALNAAANMEIDIAEAIMRVELGSRVSEISSKELKRDLLIYAKKNPSLFLELANDDNIQLRNFGIKATELGVIKLSNNQRDFYWSSNNRKLMTVPFDEHPYTALAHWFKTDEGMEVYSNIEKRLK
tara:strand:+ start:450 stop:1289 length:840 start_codon:yes stop_codon:yes gene_type:complete